MKRHSILTTLFPRLAFSSRPLQRVLDEASNLKWEDTDHLETKSKTLKPWLGVIVKHGDELPEIFVKRWLPTFSVDAGEGAKQIECHLIYREVDENFELLKRTKNPAMAHILLGARRADGTFCELSPLELPEQGSYVGEPAPIGDDDKFRRIWNLLLSPEVAHIDLFLRIEVLSQSACRIVEKKLSDLQYAARRKEWVASELTTGYRRVICHLLQCLSSAAHHWKHKSGSHVPLELASDLPSPSILNTNQSDGLHSTPEDAWRLLCSFHSVEVCAKEVNKKGHHVLGLQDFITGLTSAIGSGAIETPALVLLQTLYEKKSIARRVGLRKCLEYFIFEELPSLPR